MRYKAPAGGDGSSAVSLPSGTVTFLFTDIEGSTRLLAARGGAYRDLQEAHREILRAAFARHGGIELGTEGDSFFVVFSTAGAAVRSAVNLQRELEAHDWPEGARVRVRAGIHTGEASPVAGQYVSLAVNQAARVSAAAHGGQILVSETTRALAGHDLPEDVTLGDLGPHMLKDLARPERLYQVCHPGLQREFPPLKTLESRPHNLPVQQTPFTGRQPDLARAREFVLRPGLRLLTVTGPGGMGKTRLALQVAAESADDFADGVWFVPLASVTNAEDVPRAVAQALGIRESPGAGAAESVLSELRTKRRLVVLDNFEQVMEASSFVRDLLATCPDVTVLVTSREPLHLSGEQEMPLQPMELPATTAASLEDVSSSDAVRLYVQRAMSVNPDFQLDESSAPAVAEVCARLDGLPLAIELAASRSKVLGPHEMLSRMESRLEALPRGPEDLPERHQSLRQTIGWSYDLLDEGERKVLRRVAVFRGGFEAEAAFAVVGGGPEIADVLHSLVDKSLIRRAVSPPGVLRFELLETIREFAGEKLHETGEDVDTRRRHAAWFLKQAERADAHLREREQIVWLQRLEADHDNFRAVLERTLMDGADPALGVSLAGRLSRFWRVHSHFREGRMWLARSVAASAPGSAQRVMSLLGQVRLTPTGTSAPVSQKEGLAAVATSPSAPTMPIAAADTSPPDPRARTSGAVSDFMSGFSTGHQGGPARSKGDRDAWLREAEQTARALGDQRLLLDVLVEVTDVAYLDPTRRPLADEAIALAQALGDETTLADLEYRVERTKGGPLAFFRSLMGRSQVDESRRQFVEARGDKTALAGLLQVRVRSGNERHRKEAAGEALGLARELGDRRLEASSLMTLGTISGSTGDPHLGKSLLEQSLSIFRDLEDDESVRTNLRELIFNDFRRGDRAAADHHRAEIYRMADAAGDSSERFLIGVMDLIIRLDRAGGTRTVVAGVAWSLAFATKPWGHGLAVLLSVIGWFLAGGVRHLVVSRTRKLDGASRWVLGATPASLLSFWLGLKTRSAGVASTLLLAWLLVWVLKRLPGTGLPRLMAIAAAVAGLVTAWTDLATVSLIGPPAAVVVVCVLLGTFARKLPGLWRATSIGWLLIGTWAPIGAMHALAVSRTGGGFGFGLWGLAALPLVVLGLLLVAGALVVHDPPLRWPALLVGLTSLGLFLALSSPRVPSAAAAGVAFGLAWAAVGMTRIWLNHRPLPPVTPDEGSPAPR
ncbi:MAG TPA: adenylate/guanylate cyclase domain-containing protein [Actinomycetota bacterium]|nr:adenylate/guanylate cyclase domain-containing protein [Actinomycetota bacterium]